jgi:chromosome segregation ATPase
MQKYTVNENPHCPEGTSDEISQYLPAGTVLYAAAGVDAEIESLKLMSVANVLLDATLGDDSFQSAQAKSADEVNDRLRGLEDLVATLEGELAEANAQLTERNREFGKVSSEAITMREVLTLLAPDLKAMAILYAQKGDHQRSQALHNICKSVGVV